MSYVHSVADLVGNTPMIRLHALENAYGLSAKLLAKLEFVNPTGSAKDRIAAAMIADAESTGRLKPGGVIIEPTSGNTGIGLAAIGVAKGYRVIIVMPDSMSVERQKLMRAYGAELVLTPGNWGMEGAIQKARELCETLPGAIIAGQFENPANPKAHYDTTGPEIENDTKGDAAAFVAGIGTGGTISGTGRYLKETIPGIRIIGVEPAASPLLTGGTAAAHGIQGIGANFVPQALDRTTLDEVLDITDDDAFAYARDIAQKEGLFVGISSGAALCGAIQVAKRPEFAGKTVVVLLPDGGSRYLSTPLVEE